MTWPSYPHNGDTATINGIEFVYANSVWNRVGSVFETAGVSSFSTANLVVTQSSQLGAAANVQIGGGSIGQFLTSNGAGGLAWAPPVGAQGVANGTSNLYIYNNANVTISVASTQNVVVFGQTTSNITGNVGISGKLNVANITTGVITSNISVGTAPLIINSNTRVSNLNVDRANLSDYGVVTRQTSSIYYPAIVNASATGNYGLSTNPNFSYDLTNSIFTSVNLTLSGNASAVNLSASNNTTTSNLSVSVTANLSGSNISLGNTGNVKLTGGSSGQYLTTDGTGNISWSAVSLSNIDNGTSNVSVALNGNVSVKVAGNLNILTLTGTGANIGGYANVTGSITGGGNIDIPGSVNASILTSNVTTGTAPLNVTSTTRVANLNVARANISDYTSVTTTSSGNVSLVFASANTTSNYALQSNTAIYANLSNGNVYATNFVGNVVGNVVGNATTASTVITSAQPNITSVGTLFGLTATGTVSFTSATSVGLGSNTNVKLSGGSSGQFLYTDGTGNLSWGAVVLATVQNGTSNIVIPTINGNINHYANGNLILVVTSTGSNLNGTYSNVLGNLTVVGNIDTPNSINASTLSSNVATGTTPLKIVSTTRVANLNVDRANISDYTSVSTTSSGNLYFAGASTSSSSNYALVSNTAIYANLSTSTIYAVTFNGNVTGNAGFATTAGTVTVSAQPNITSHGNLTALQVGNTSSTGTVNFINTSNVSLGNIANLKVTGGSSGQVLQTDGTGNLSFVVPSVTSVANGTSNISLSTNGNIAFNSNGVSNIMTVNGVGGNSVNIANLLNMTPVGTSASPSTTSINMNYGNINNVYNINSVSYTVSGNLNVAGWTNIAQTQETIVPITASGATVTCNLATGSTFWCTGMNQNFTVAFTNVPTVANIAVNVTLFLIQNSTTGYLATGVTINGYSALGAGYLIWPNGVIPTPSASRKEAESLSLIYTAGSWYCFGQLSSFA